MALTFSGGASGGILTPTPSANVATDNYTDIVTLGANKLLPDSYDNLVERFGNQSIQGFLAKTSAEFPLKSDLIEWQEEGRLHIYYEGRTLDADGGAGSASDITLPSGHPIRVGQIVKVEAASTFYLGYVSAKSDTTIDVLWYGSTPADSTDASVRVVGSEFNKGTAGMVGSVETETTNYSNRPTIMKDKYEINGSDTAQIGWIQVSGGAESSPFGMGGWLWYLKSEMDNRARFMDLLETQALEIRTATAASTFKVAEGDLGRTEGVFQSLESRAINTATSFADATPTFAEFSSNIDSLLKELDLQGAIQENLMYLNRDESLNIDNGLALANSYGTGGQSYGAFSNSSDMALNLGFKSFTRGSYTFHKTDWKYLNQIDTVTETRGILAPAGSMNVYDQGIGSTAKRPFIHVRYKASQTDNRKMKHWITGSVGASNSDLDAMQIHYLSERCTVVQGANNFVLFA